MSRTRGHHLAGGEEQDLTMTVCALKLELAESRTSLDEARHANRLLTKELEQAQFQINAECALCANLQQRLNDLEKAVSPERLRQCATENTALRVSLECTVAQRDAYKSRCRALMDQNEWMRDAFDRAGLSPLCYEDDVMDEEAEDNRWRELHVEPAPAGAGHSSAMSGSVSNLKGWLTANITTRMHALGSNSLSSSSSSSTRTMGNDGMPKALMAASLACSEATDPPCHQGNSCRSSSVPSTISCEEIIKEGDVELRNSVPLVAFKRKISKEKHNNNMPKQHEDTARPAQVTFEVTTMPSTDHENDADGCSFSDDCSLSLDDLPVLRKSLPSSEGGTTTSKTANLGSLNNTYNSNLTCDTMQDVENFLTGSPSISKMLNEDVIIPDPENDSLFDDLEAPRNKQASLAGRTILAGCGFHVPTLSSVLDGQGLNQKCQMDSGFPRPPAA